MKSSILAVAVLSFCSFGLAQNLQGSKANPELSSSSQAKAVANAKQAAADAVSSPLVSSDCAFTFTSGTERTFQNFCVTVNGNIAVFEAPQGHPLITLSRNEGYGFCDTTSNVAYFDYAADGDSGNWQPATVVSHNATSVKIVRNTADGLWQLTQTISQITGDSPAAKIIMTLKNNSGVQKLAHFVRYGDVDADAFTSNNLDATVNGAIGWASQFNTPHGYGLLLRTVGNPNPPMTITGLVQNSFHGPNPCDVNAHFHQGLETDIDGSLVILFEPVMNPGKSQTMTATYRGF